MKVVSSVLFTFLELLASKIPIAVPTVNSFYSTIFRERFGDLYFKVSKEKSYNVTVKFF